MESDDLVEFSICNVAPSLFSMQESFVGFKCVDDWKRDPSSMSGFASIYLQPVGFFALTRITGCSQDVSNRISLDCRVLQVPQLNCTREAGDNSKLLKTSQEVENKGLDHERKEWSFSEDMKQTNCTRKKVMGLYTKRDLVISKLVEMLSGRKNRDPSHAMSSLSLSSPFSLYSKKEGEEDTFVGLPSTMLYNDSVSCTSKDIKMLKSGAIKMMRLTLICYLDHIAEQSLSFNSSSVGVQTLGMLTEKIRSVFTSYDLRVMDHCIVDVRECPISKIKMTCLPPVAFIVVNQCLMKNETVEIGRVNSSTSIHIDIVQDIGYYRRALASLSKHKGSCSVVWTESFERAKCEIDKRMAWTLSLENHINHQRGDFRSIQYLITGAPRCGKKTFLRNLALHLNTELIVLDIKSVSDINFDSACSECYSVFSKACHLSKLYPTILLLLSLDVLGSPKENDRLRNSSNKKKIASYLSLLIDLVSRHPNNKLCLIGVSNRPHFVPSALTRSGRLERQLYIQLPTAKERLQYLKLVTQDIPELSADSLNELSELTSGYSFSDLHKIYQMSIFEVKDEDWGSLGAHMKNALCKVIPAALEDSFGVVNIQNSLTLDDIVGLERVKFDLIKTIVWPLKFSLQLSRLGVTPSKGILLYGPPGCAKTTLVRAVASSHETNFLSVSAAELFSSGVGESEKIVAHLFHRARVAAPCILFLDELESILGARDGGNTRGKSANESILSMFLTEMDGIGMTGDRQSEMSQASGLSLIVVAATNRPDLIDTALLRPGRFDKIVYVPPPDFTERCRLFKSATKNMPLCCDVNLIELAERTENYSGADVVNICQEAGLNALSENMEASSVNMFHFRKALEASKSSISSEALKFYENYSI